MGKGFLQGFYSAQILGSPSASVARQGYTQALHLAMLGLAPEAHAIFTLLHAHDLTPHPAWTQKSAIALFYLSANLPPPSGVYVADAAELQRETLRFPASYIHEPDRRAYDLGNVTEERYNTLREYAAKIRGEEHADAETGYKALEVSSALTLLLFMADKLNKQSDVQDLLSTMSGRIHANGQAPFLAGVSAAWRWFFPGGLRRAMELDEDELKTYASFVHDTLKTRLEDGPLLPGEVYKGWTVRQLLDELDRNTFFDPEFDPREHYFDEEDAASAPTTILKPPTTPSAIAAKETEMGRKLPDALRELLMISDGCHPATTSPGFRAIKFPSLEDIFLEEEDYMDDYGFTLLPDFEVLPKRPRGVDVTEWPYSFTVELGRYGGGIAVYEHDGQGTEYVWVIPKQTLDAAREKVREVHAKVSDEQKGRIEAEIVRRYGSREVYEGMDYCVYTQGFACPEGQGVYPDFMSYLQSVVFDSRVSVDRSPVKAVKP